MKRLSVILFAITIILCGGAYLAYTHVDLIFTGIISRKVKVPVTIKKVQFDTESFQIQELQIANPEGVDPPTALKVETIKVDAPYRHYFKDPIIIDQIQLSHVYVNIQIYNEEQTEGNWHTIMHNMEQERSSLFSVERPARIKKLILTNIQIDLILSDGSVHHLSPIDRLEFDDIDSEKGIPIQEISEIIVHKMMGSILLKKGLKIILEIPVGIIKKVLPFL
ncbi:MAG: hypothetical protein QNJ27_03590 [Simkaniaceae bacterium]|nr:hypothetical protein [Simkaniaceae bacterium]